MGDPFNATSSEWLETAWSNFERACRAIKFEDYAQVVFYAHQTVETAIKAYLTSKGYKVLHTHDLKVLVEEAIKLSLKIDIKSRDLEELSMHYFATRYPDARRRLKIPKEYYTRKVALKFLNLAYKILTLVEEEL
ncbi:MAG: HEPN domain-containing protein [Candidatus Baldrarchaeia archaeon]